MMTLTTKQIIYGFAQVVEMKGMQKCKQPKVSIITIHKNNLELLDDYLKALRRNTFYPNWELILVDNCSLSSFMKDIKGMCLIAKGKLLMMKKNQSFAFNCNAGADEAEGEVLCFVNDDTIPQPNWLTEMVKLLVKDRRHGIIGPKMFFPNGVIQHAGIAFHEDHMAGHIWWNKLKKDDPKVNRVREFQAVTGGCLMIWKDLFKEIGGFDEVYEYAGYEDLDLCCKVRQKGYKVMYCPKSELIHYEKVTQNKFDPQTRHKYFVKNTETFLTRWYDFVKPDYHKFERGVK